MKICMLTYRGNPYCGGQGIYVGALAAELARQGHEVHCVSGPPYPLAIPGVTVHQVPGLQLYGENGAAAPGQGPWWPFAPLNIYDRAAFHAGIFSEMTTFSIRAFLLVRKLLRSHAFDVIHDNQTLGWGLLPMLNLGVPLFATIHHPLTEDRLRGFEPPTTLRQQLGRMLFYPIIMQGFVARRMPRVVTVSHAAARKIAEDFRVPAEKITVIYNGVDTGVFRPLPGISRVPGRVLFVGNIEDPNKGGAYLLQALARMKQPARLEIVTGGLAEPAVFHATLGRLGIAAKVGIHYRLTSEKLAAMYASAQVAVSPSVFEGFGFPAAEAMACEVPLVAARGGALPEVVGETGLTVPVRDPEALATALDTLLADAPRREKLGRAGRRRVLRKFQWPEAARQMAQVYQEVADAYRGL